MEQFKVSETMLEDLSKTQQDSFSGLTENWQLKEQINDLMKEYNDLQKTHLEERNRFSFKTIESSDYKLILHQQDSTTKKMVERNLFEIPNQQINILNIQQIIMQSVNEKEKNLHVLDMQFQNIGEKLKEMSKNELLSQIENLETISEQQRNEIENLQKDLQHFKGQGKNYQQFQEEMRNKISALTIQNKNSLKENEKLKKEMEIDKQMIKKLAQQHEKIRKVLESQNKENYSGMKQIRNLYQNDAIVVQIIDENIKKQLSQLQSTEKNLKTEMKIHTIFCREYIKIIMYMKNVHRQSQELKRIQQSLGLSHMVKESELNKVSELFNHSLVSDQFKKPNVLQGIEDKMEELKAFFDVQQVRNSSVENIELEEKLNELKGENHALNQELFIYQQKVATLERESQDIKQELQHSLVRLQKVISSFKESQNEEEFDLENEDKSFKHKLYQDRFEEMCKMILTEMKKEDEEIKTKPQALQKIASLEEELKKYKKQFYDLQDAHEEQGRQLFSSLQKQKYLEENNGKLVEEENKEDQYLNHAIISNFKAEIKAKNEVILNLQEVNSNLFKRLENMHSERLEVLRDKQHCEDMYKYFKEKSDRIYVMNVNLARVTKTNALLKNLINKFLTQYDKSNEEFKTDYNEKDALLLQIVEETKQSLYLAQYHYDTFKADIFDDGLEQRKKQENKEKKDDEKDEEKIIIQKETEDAAQSIAEESSEKVEIRLNDADRASYARTITQLNRAMIENDSLREKIDLQGKKILELNKDLVLFQKKAKMFADLESKIDQMVGENIQMKKFLQDFQNIAIENSKDVRDDITAFDNFVDMQNDILDKTKEYLKNILKDKRAAEKKVFTLQRKLEEQEKILEVTKNNLRIRDRELDLEKKEKEKAKKEIKELETELEKEKLESEKRRVELDKAQKSIQSLNSTVVLLEKNLYNLTSSKTGDGDILRKEIEQQKEIILQKQLEEKDQYSKLAIAEKAQQNLGKKLQEREKIIKEKDENIEKLQNNINRLEKDKGLLREDIDEMKRQLIKKEIERDGMKYERENIEQKNELLKNEIENLKQESQNLILNEKKRLQDEVKAQWKEEMDKTKADLSKYKNKVAELQYEKGRLEREQDDANIKLQLRNKQLLHFYSFFLKNDSSSGSSGEIQHLLVQNKDLLREIEMLRLENQQVQTLYNELQSNLDKKIIQNPHKKIQRIEDDIQNMKASLVFINEQDVVDQANKYEFEALMQMYEEKNSHLEKIIENQRQKTVQLESLLQKTQKEKSLKEENLREIEMEYSVLKKSIEELREDNQQQNFLNEQLKIQLENLKKELENAKLMSSMQGVPTQQAQETAKLRQINMDQQKQINTLEQKLREKNKELNQLDKSLYQSGLTGQKTEAEEVLKSMNKKLEDENKDLKSQLSDLKSENILMQQEMKELKDKRVKELNNKIKQETMKRQDSEKNLFELKGITNELQENQMSYLSEITSLKIQIQELEGENEDLIDEIESSKKNTQRLNEKIKVLNKEKVLLANHINNLKKESEKIQKEAQLNEDLLFEIENEIKTNMPEAQQKYLEKMKTDLENAQARLKTEQEHSAGLVKKQQEITDMLNAQLQKQEQEILQLQQKEQQKSDYFHQQIHQIIKF